MATDRQHIPSKGWPILATLVTLVAVVIMFALGNWQLNRADQKAQRLEQIAARQTQSDISLHTLITMNEDIRDINFRASGELLKNQVFLLDNRIHQGRVGYHVLVPLSTESGLLMVNFGWVKAGASRQELPDFALPDNPVSVSGIASVPSDNPLITETATPGEAWPVVIQQVDIDVFNSFLNKPVLNFVMLLEPQQDSGFEREWQLVVMSPQKHLGYAIQWFGLAIACIVVFVFALKKRYRNSHE